MATEEFGEVETPSVEIKLFGKWSADEVHVNDISLAVSIHSCKPIHLQVDIIASFLLKINYLII